MKNISQGIIAICVALIMMIVVKNQFYDKMDKPKAFSEPKENELIVMKTGDNTTAKKSVVIEKPAVEITDFRYHKMDKIRGTQRISWMVVLSGNGEDNKVATTFQWLDKDERVLFHDVADTVIVPTKTFIRVTGETLQDTTLINKTKWLAVKIYYEETE